MGRIYGCTPEMAQEAGSEKYLLFTASLRAVTENWIFRIARTVTACLVLEPWRGDIHANSGYFFGTYGAVVRLP